MERVSLSTDRRELPVAVSLHRAAGTFIPVVEVGSAIRESQLTRVFTLSLYTRDLSSPCKIKSATRVHTHTHIHTIGERQKRRRSYTPSVTLNGTSVAKSSFSPLREASQSPGAIQH